MTVTWIITQLDRQETKDSLSDVVSNVHWYAYETKQINGIDYSGKEYGSVTLNSANSLDFKTYSLLTQNDVIPWIKNILGSDEITKIESSISAQITKASEPVLVSGVPW